MEFQKIVNFLDTNFDNKDLPTFFTKKWIEFYHQSEGNYNVNKDIKIKTSMSRSDLCDFSDAYIVAKGNITVTKKTFTADDIDAPNNTAANVSATNAANNNAFDEKKLVFKNNAPFINCISKINGVKIDNAEDLDVVMPMYNLLEYGKYHKKTTGRFGADPNVYEIDNPDDATFKITDTKLFVPVVTLSKENDTRLLE